MNTINITRTLPAGRKLLLVSNEKEMHRVLFFLATVMDWPPSTFIFMEERYRGEGVYPFRYIFCQNEKKILFLTAWQQRFGIKLKSEKNIPSPL